MKYYSTLRFRTINRALFVGLCLLFFSAVSSCGGNSEEEKATAETSQSDNSSSNSSEAMSTNSTESEETEKVEASQTESNEATESAPVASNTDSTEVTESEEESVADAAEKQETVAEAQTNEATQSEEELVANAAETEEAVADAEANEAEESEEELIANAAETEEAVADAEANEAEKSKEELIANAAETEETVADAEATEATESEEESVANAADTEESVVDEQTTANNQENAAALDTEEINKEENTAEMSHQTTDSTEEQTESEVSQSDASTPAESTEENTGEAETLASAADQQLTEEDPANPEQVANETVSDADMQSESETTVKSETDEALPVVSATNESETESEGAGWRAVQGDPDCCGTGCATACPDGEVEAAAKTVEAENEETIVAAKSEAKPASEGAGWRAVQGDPDCCGTGCATACPEGEAPAMAAESDETDASETVVQATNEAKPAAEGAGWRAVQGDPDCCGTGCATACPEGEAQPMAAESVEEESETIVLATNEATPAMEGSGWRAIQGDSECCGTGCATECESGDSLTMADTQESSTASESANTPADAAGWRAIQGDTECCGTGCATACETGEDAATASTEDTTTAAAASKMDPVDAAGWRAIQGDTECCGTGCATACETAEESSMNGTEGTDTSQDQVPADAAGWRAIQGDTECCGTGCATACEAGEDSPAADNPDTATAPKLQPASEGAGWRSLEGDTECCGTGCAKACDDAEVTSMTEEDQASNTSLDPVKQSLPEEKDADGWRAIQGDTECCGTGCAMPCVEQESSSTDAQDTLSSTQHVTKASGSNNAMPSPQIKSELTSVAAMTEKNSDQSLYTVRDGKVDEKTWIGSKIYQRVFGRGCGTCHNVQSNPDLTISLKSIERDEFADIMRNGRNNGKMPATLDSIMTLGPVKKAQLTEVEAIDAIYAYLRGRALGDIPAGRVSRIN